ncbi:hypothetical protein VTL71DRAFT_2743 [Oculimacula yallundae]|uniref:BTB domain-containing protein n=1 Tax=Oculimacula yallundae TaxID=86028 RepID=A0ABR4C9S4_9HELO
MATSDPTTSKVPERIEDEFKGVGELTSNSSDMVTIYVGSGPGRKRWIIHEAVICNKSTFFRSAFQGGFAEGSSKEMTLEEDDPAVFKLFVDWVYGSAETTCKLDHQDKSTNMSLHLMGWYGLDILGDKIRCQALREHAFSSWENCLASVDDVFRHSAKEIEMIFENSPADNGFKEHVVFAVMVDYLRPEFSEFWYLGDLMSCSRLFAEEFTKRTKEHMMLPAAQCWANCSTHNRDADGRLGFWDAGPREA